MRALSIVLACLLVLIQHPLWTGKGGWFQVRVLERQVNEQIEANRQQHSRNEALEAEVNDLRTGRHAVEERARFELGMVRSDEVFVQLHEAASIPAQRVQTARVERVR